METKNDKVDDWDFYYNPDPKEEAAREARRAVYWPKVNAFLDKVRAGEMTEDECAAAILKLEEELGCPSDYTPAQKERSVRNFMMHSLHQEELDRIQRETGTIID
jgi:hypothetical protein